jgi:hypothetical protein
MREGDEHRELACKREEIEEWRQRCKGRGARVAGYGRWLKY